MKTAIRMDDICGEMDYAKFQKIKAILDEADIKPLIGVVPFCKDDTLRVEKYHEDFGTMVAGLAKNGWMVALHGYNHLYTTRDKGIFPINSFSEYAGVDYDRQCVMIREGILKLKEWGLKPQVFMAPGHTFDKNTLKALKDNGISAVTDGFGSRPYVREGITFYPISKKRSECISDKDAYSTYVLHTNTMSEEGIEAFERMLKEHRECFIDYDEYMQATADKRGWAGNLYEYMLAYAKHLLVSRRASSGTVIHEQE